MRNDEFTNPVAFAKASATKDRLRQGFGDQGTSTTISGFNLSTLQPFNALLLSPFYFLQMKNLNTFDLPTFDLQTIDKTYERPNIPTASSKD